MEIKIIENEKYSKHLVESEKNLINRIKKIKNIYVKNNKIYIL